MARVLVIDDSPTSCRFLRTALEPEGHTVVSLESSAGLSRQLREFRPQIVFLDLEMPGIGGLQIGAFLRRVERARAAVVVFSSRPLTELEEACRRLGADAVLEKGCDARAVRELVEKLGPSDAGEE